MAKALGLLKGLFPQIENQAKTLGAIACREGNIPKLGKFALLTDPTGAMFGLVGSSESRKL